MGRKVPPIRMAVAEDTPHALLDVLEDFNRFDDVSSRDAGVMKKALYVNIPEIESQIMLGTKHASRHGHRFAQQ